MKSLFISLTFLLFFLYATGVENFYIVSLTGNKIVAGDSLELSDPQFPLYQNKTARYKSLVSRVFLKVIEEDRILLDSNWSVSVDLLVTYADTSENATVNIPVLLEVNYKTGIASYHGKDAFEIMNAQYVKYKIVSVSDSSLTPYLTLGIEMGAERFYSFDPFAVVGNLSHSFNIATNKLELSWSPVMGGELYEVSWLWVNNYGPSGNSLSATQMETSFKHRSSRIISETEHYEIPLIYDKGFIVYRVRPIGIDGPDFNHLVRGYWTFPNHDKQFNLSTTPHKHRIVQGHDLNLNYQHTTGYNEDGKRQDGVVYADGLFMPRQSVTSLNEEGKSLIGETIYDFHGRPAVKILPAPEPGQGTLKFAHNFNMNDQQSNYTATDFDLDSSNTGLQAGPLQTTSGSSQYYSPQNPDQHAHSGFIPNAEGYPFAQTSYTTDKTGRIKSVGSTGKEHQIGSGHETKYYYSKPFQVELDRLFGNEIGYSSRYNKTKSLDPNGVVHVSYVNGSGNVVATALGSATADNLLPVELESDTIRADLLDNNEWSLTKFVKPATQPLVVTDSGTYLFQYHIHSPQYTYSCGNQTFCFNVNYQVIISVVNENGLEMIPNGPITFDLGDHDSSVYSCSGLTDTALSFQLSLVQGQYTISKRLGMDMNAIEEFVDSITANCTPGIETFATPPDLSGCVTDCQQCELTPGDKVQFLAQGGTEDLWEDMVNICNTLCDTVSICASYYNIMLFDVSPGGYYGGVWDQDGVISPANYPFSVYNELNLLGSGALDWRHPATPYLDENGNNDSIQVGNGQFYAPQNLPSLEIFLNNWKQKWAHSLMPYHPEYCFYQRCTEFEMYRAYESATFSTLSFQDALNAGYMNPLENADTTIIPSILLNPTTLDPLFLNGAPGAAYLDSMRAWINDYNNSGLSLWSFIGLVSGSSACATPSDSLKFGATGTLNTATLDLQWLMFRAHYLVLRNRVLDLLKAQWQIDNKCFNVCLDKQSAIKKSASLAPSYTHTLLDLSTPTQIDISEGLVKYDTLIIIDSVCFYKNDPGTIVDLGTHIGYPNLNDVYPWTAQNTTLPVGQLGTAIKPNTKPDSCVCRTMKDLFEKFPYQNNLVAFTTYYDAVFETNLTTQQVIDILYACREEEHFEGGSNDFPQRCVFDDPFNYIPKSSSSCDTALSNFDQHCATTCAYNIPYWRQQLTPCISDSILMANILERMVAICKSGCDPTHPMGSSTSPPSYLTSFGDSSFQQLLQANTSCNPYIISQPPPYAYKMANSIDGQIDSCACSDVTSAYSAYPDSLDLVGFTTDYNSSRSLSMSVSEIKSFLCICQGTVDSNQLCDPNSDITLMVSNSIRCSYCVACSTIENHLNDFALAYPGIDIGYANASIIQNYLNTQLNYTIGFSSYMSLMDTTFISCIAQSATICNGPLFPDAPIDSSCYEDALIFAQQESAFMHQQYQDSLKEVVLASIMNQALDHPYEEFEMTYILIEGYYTLYYYDQAGNLERTVPPEGVQIIKDKTVLAGVHLHREHPQTYPAVYPAHKLSSRYLFSALNGTYLRNTPDGDKTLFWYDQLGRITATQLANQTANDRYNYNIHDGLGRLIESGELTNNSQISLTHGLSEADYHLWIDDGTKHHFTKVYFDSAAYEVPGLRQVNLRNKVSAMVKYDSRHDSRFTTHYTYDVQGNVNAVVQENSLIPAVHKFKKTEYEYDILGGTIDRVTFQKGQQDQFIHRYFYDKDVKLITAQTSVNGFDWEEDASYSFYQHGSLARIELGALKVQGTDYAYTIQGWLKAINSGTLVKGDDMGIDADLGMPGNPHQYVAKDAFGFIIQYFEDDYNPINGFNQFLSGTGGSSLYQNSGDLYNGNIPLTILHKENEPIVGKAYRYDVLNRIRSSHIYANFDSLNGQWLNNGNFSLEHSTTYQYDLNGNFTNLTRKGTLDTALNMDDLSYSYYPNSNQLAYVQDADASSSYSLDIDNQQPNNYRYDPSGNLIHDTQEGIEYNWSSLGKVEGVVGSGNSNRPNLSFYYDATDNRVMKEIEGDSLLWYVYGADNSLMAIYSMGSNPIPPPTYETAPKIRNPSLPINIADTARNAVVESSPLTYSPYLMRLVDYLLYGTAKLGLYSPNKLLSMSVPPSENIDTTHFNLVRGDKRYTLSDQLGNVQMVISDKNKGYDVDNDGTADYYQAVVINSTDYYPFGMEMPGRGVSNEQYRYGFQGQEKDEEVKGKGNSINYTFRMHDPRLGRFFAIDPLAPGYPSNSPYAFSENRVMDAVELEGLEAYFYHGTNSSVKESWNLKTAQKIVQGIPATLGNTESYLRTWSGHNNSLARRVAAKRLAKFIVKTHTGYEPITIIGHSHGGNVSKMVAEIVRDRLGPDVEIILITMNTPMRTKESQPEYHLSRTLLDDENFTHFNFSLYEDDVQKNNGGTTETGIVEDQSKGTKKSWLGSPVGFMAGKFLNLLGIENTLGGERGKSPQFYGNGKTHDYIWHTQYSKLNVKKAHRIWEEKNSQMLLDILDGYMEFKKKHNDKYKFRKI